MDWEWFKKGEPQNPLQVVSLVTKANFARYLDDLAGQRGWVHIKSPYQVENKDGSEDDDDDERSRLDSHTIRNVAGIFTMLGINND